MKTKKLLALSLGLLFTIFFMQAQEEDSYYTISGIVKNEKNKSNIEYVNVSATGTNVGTISNENGEFSLKIKKNLPVNEIEFSCIGFYNVRFKIMPKDLLNQVFWMTPRTIELKPIEVRSWKNPEELVAAAIDKIAENYSSSSSLLTGFYRETAQKRNKYINLSEAVIQIYKSSYKEDASRDRVQVLKGRRLISSKVNDTLAVKLLGGPNLSILVDIVKNPDLLLDPKILSFYKYKMGESASINNRIQYVVYFEPKMTLDYPLYYGAFYIDRDNLSFTRAEFKIDMRDKKKVTDIILKQKPSGLRFSPESLTYVVSYLSQGDKTYLNYIRTEIKFKCDWKRRLFATNYTVVGEMVITDKEIENVEKISSGNAFSIKHSLSDKVMGYYDNNFWGAYNIIEPTESLESAVGKLKKTNLSD
jgi:hypothetical protein